MVHAGCIYVKLWNVICFGTRSYYHHGPCTERIHLTGRNHDQKRVTQKGKEERRRNSFIYNNSFHLNILVGINFLILKFKKLNMKQLLLTRLFGCVPLRWSGSGSVIQDHSDHGRSKFHLINRQILVQSGFIGLFDLQWSEWFRITDRDPDHLKGMHPLWTYTI